MSLIDPQGVTLVLPQQRIDKIVGLFEGSFTVPSNGISSETVTHNKNKTPLLSELLWSTDNTNYYLGATMRDDSLCVTNGVGVNTATLYGGWFVSGGAVTVNYKLYLIWPN